MKSNILLILFVLLACSLNGQTIYERNASAVILFSSVLPLENPSAISIENDRSVFLGSLRRMGAWNVFNSYFAQGSFKFYNSRNGYNSSYLGIKVNAENDGLFVRYRDLMVAYSWKVRVGDEFIAVAAIELGGTSLFVDGNDRTGNISDMVMNSNAGALVSNNKLTIGASAMQLMPSSLKSKNINLQMSTYYNFHASYKFKLNELLNIKPTILYKVKPNIENEFNLNIEATIGEHFAPNIGYLMKTGMYYSVAITNIELEKTHLDFCISYLVPTAIDYTKVSRYEFIMKCKF